MRCKLLPFPIVCFLILWISPGTASAQEKKTLTRIARITIDSSSVDRFGAMLKEEIESALHGEPGVLMLYAVRDRKNPSHITVFEVYADADAYASHLQTPHFKKYKSGTADMVKSLELIDADPIAAGIKK